MFEIVIYTLCIFIGLVKGQLPSPCPEIFSYEPRGTEQDRWYGVLSLQSREDLNGVWLHLQLDRPAELLGNWFGEATSTDNKDFAIKNPKYKLEAGPPVSVRFFVKYNAASTIPSLTGVRLNGKTICSTEDRDLTSTTPRLHISQQVRPSSDTGNRFSSENTNNNRPSSNRPQASRPNNNNNNDDSIVYGVSTDDDNYGTSSNFNNQGSNRRQQNNRRPTSGGGSSSSGSSFSNNGNSNHRGQSQQNTGTTSSNNRRPVSRPSSNNGYEDDDDYGTSSSYNNNQGQGYNNNQQNRRPNGGGGSSSTSLSSDNNNNHRGQQHQNSGSSSISSSSNGLSVEEDNTSDGADYFPGDFAVQHRPALTRPGSNRPSTINKRHVGCGTVAMKPSPLISHGQNTSQGQWPWHVALYHSQGIQLMYTCGATLISDMFIITAAHCVAKPQSNKPINPQNILAYLGKHNLKKFGSEVQDREVSDIYIHPQYNYTVYFNDVAILKLTRPVDITNYVRPCCLWDDNTEIESVTDKLGTVVGWGFDENRQLSNSLMQAQMPVVSTVKCIYSNREFFSQFTFEKTYCAGFRNGTSVCNGDSGGGMVFPKSGTSGQNTVWQIRGLVSVGVALQGQGVCDPSHYIVFTDVAKHLDWIRGIMNQ